MSSPYLCQHSLEVPVSANATQPEVEAAIHAALSIHITDITSLAVPPATPEILIHVKFGP